jgi:hypothetical protein
MLYVNFILMILINIISFSFMNLLIFCGFIRIEGIIMTKFFIIND